MSLITTIKRWWTNLLKYGGDVVDVFKPRGWVELRLIHANGPLRGQIAKSVYGRNIVTNYLGGSAGISGRDLMRRKLVPSSFAGGLGADDTATVSYVELGAGTTAETAADQALQTPLAPSTLKALTDVEFSLTNTYVTFVVDYAEGEANATISEAALYSDQSPDKAFIARKTFGSFTKTSDFTLQVRWTIRF